MLALALAVVLTLVQQPTTPKHLTIVTTASAARAAPGSRISLFLDITPRTGIHVYAPGAKDYLPIAVTVGRQSGLRIGDLKYPESETMLFEGEKVPVYEKPFRLVQEVSLARSLKAGDTLTIAGTLQYQACDDRVCFIPASVPLRWTIAIGSGKAAKAGR